MSTNIDEILKGAGYMTSNSRLDVDGDPDLDADIEIIKRNFLLHC